MSDEIYYEHYLLSGRRCGGSENSTAYIRVPEDEDPEPIFISEILYGGTLPVDWQDRLPTYEENSFGDWAYITGRIELPFGVSGSENMPQAMSLIDFRFGEGTISANAILGAEFSSIAP